MKQLKKQNRIHTDLIKSALVILTLFFVQTVNAGSKHTVSKNSAQAYTDEMINAIESLSTNLNSASEVTYSFPVLDTQSASLTTDGRTNYDYSNSIATRNGDDDLTSDL